MTGKRVSFLCEKLLLLVEDNPDDEKQFVREFRKSRILNEVLVARDGAEALDLIFGAGPDRDGALYEITRLRSLPWEPSTIHDRSLRSSTRERLTTASPFFHAHPKTSHKGRVLSAREPRLNAPATHV